MKSPRFAKILKPTAAAPQFSMLIALKAMQRGVILR